MPLAFSFHETPLWSLSLSLSHLLRFIHLFFWTILWNGTESKLSWNQPLHLLANTFFIMYANQLLKEELWFLSIVPLAVIGAADSVMLANVSVLQNCLLSQKNIFLSLPPLGSSAELHYLCGEKPFTGKRTFSLKLLSTSPVKCTKAANQGISLISVWIMPSLPC